MFSDSDKFESYTRDMLTHLNDSRINLICQHENRNVFKYVVKPKKEVNWSFFDFFVPKHDDIDIQTIVNLLPLGTVVAMDLSLSNPKRNFVITRICPVRLQKFDFKLRKWV